MAVQLGLAALTVGCIYALVALGFSIVFAASRVLNFAQGEVAMLGALVGFTTYSALHLPYAAALVLTVLTVAATGALLGRLTLIPLLRRRAGLHSLILSTVGTALFIDSASETVWGRDALPVRTPLGAHTLSILGAYVYPQSLLVGGVTALSLVLVWFFFEHTLTGQCFRAVAVNREAARLVGIDVERVVLWAFALSAGLSALAGLVLSPLVSTSAFMGPDLGVKGFAAAIVGGLGSSVGAVAGGLLIGAVETFGAAYVSSGYGDALVFGVLLLVLFLWPQGLFGGPALGVESHRDE